MTVAIKTEYSVQVPTEPGLYLDAQIWDDGYWHCDEFNEPKWCEHLAKMVSENRDAEIWPTVWKEHPEFHVQVPIIPTLAVFQEVALIPVTLGRVANPNAAEVMVLDRSLKPAAPEIGYMNVGDGLSALRVMILDWFQGWIMGRTELKCQSGLHKYSAELEWQASRGDPNRWLAQKFTVWKTRNCMICRKGFQAASDDDDDLIPDPGKPSSPWSR